MSQVTVHVAIETEQTIRRNEETGKHVTAAVESKTMARISAA
jgi:hypothetical protein